MENKIKVSYVTTLPKLGNAPSISIYGDKEENYYVKFLEKKDDRVILLSHGYCKNNNTIFSATQQWYTNWIVEVFDSRGDLVFIDVFDLKGKTVFIKMDSYGLGDSIAWIPYVEQFRVNYGCNVICSTFYNYLFIESYPNILFVNPNTEIKNVYAQYYIGASNEKNKIYSKIKVNENPLQKVASETLGIEYKELIPDLSTLCFYSKRKIHKKYVTLSEFGSSSDKNWKYENGWQSVVNYLNKKGFVVVVISKEKTQLKNIIDLTGDDSLISRSIDIKHAEFHLGVSSGLSWLAWALGTHVVMVSDVTPVWHEFNTKITRISSNYLSCVDYNNESISNVEKVISELENLISCKNI